MILNWMESRTSAAAARFNLDSLLFAICQLHRVMMIPFDSIEISDRHCCYYWFFPSVLTALPSYSLLSSTSHLTSDDDAFTLFSMSSLCNFMLWLPCEQCIILFLLQPFIDESSHQPSAAEGSIKFNYQLWATCELKYSLFLPAPHTRTSPCLFPMNLSMYLPLGSASVKSSAIAVWARGKLLHSKSWLSSVVRGDAKIPFISRVQPRLIALAAFQVRGLLQSRGEGRKKTTLMKWDWRNYAYAKHWAIYFNLMIHYDMRKRSGERGWWYSVDVWGFNVASLFTRSKETGEHFKWIRMRAATFFFFLMCNW